MRNQQLRCEVQVDSGHPSLISGAMIKRGKGMLASKYSVRSQHQGQAEVTHQVWFEKPGSHTGRHSCQPGVVWGEGSERHRKSWFARLFLRPEELGLNIGR